MAPVPTFVGHAINLPLTKPYGTGTSVSRHSQKRPRRYRFSCIETPEKSKSFSASDDSQPFSSNTNRSKLTARDHSPDKHATVSPAVSNGLAADDSASDSTSSQGLVQISIAGFEASVPARWLLYSVPFFWGSFGPAVRLLFSQDPHPDPSIFNSERLLLSTLVYFPILAAEFTAFRNAPLSKKRDDEQVVDEDRFSFFRAGVELGVYVFLANVAQVLGLQQTSASRAAFLVQLQTVIVPVLSGVLGLDKISGKTWISSIVAVAGVALLSSDKGHGTVSSLSGDALEVLSAVFFSAYIIRLGNYCNEVAATPLVATKIAVQTVLSFAWVACVEIGSVLSHHTPTDVSVVAEDQVTWTLVAVAVNILVVAWTGLMSSAVSGWAQTKGQQVVPASEAVVVFATQPLWASALAAVILGESFGMKGFAGGALIVAATLIASKPDDAEKEEVGEG